MDWPHLHVLGNHLPIIGIPIAWVLLVWGLVKRSRDLVRAAAVGAVIFGLSAWGVSQAGDRAHDALETAKVAWVEDRTVEEHEERADTATWVAVVGAVLGLGLLWASRGGRVASGRMGWLLAGVLAIASVLMAWTGLAGGAIRHDEFLRGGVPPAAEVEHDGSGGG